MRFQWCWTKPRGEETPGFSPIQQGHFDDFGGPKSNNIGQNQKNKKIPLGKHTRKLVAKSRITLDCDNYGQMDLNVGGPFSLNCT